VEDEGKQQGRGKETIREHLVKRQQNHQIRRGLGHNLIFLRHLQTQIGELTHAQGRSDETK
jgi:hypothetical protein